MTVALLFSAVIHVVTVAFIMAHLLAFAFDKRESEVGVEEFAKISALFGLACGVVAALLMLPLYSTGVAITVGLVVAVLAGTMLSLFSAVRPMATGDIRPPVVQRPEALTFYGTFVFMQLVAFSVIAAQLAGAGRGS